MKAYQQQFISLAHRPDEGLELLYITSNFMFIVQENYVNYFKRLFFLNIFTNMHKSRPAAQKVLY